MAGPVTKSLTFPSNISRNLRTICICPYRPFSSSTTSCAPRDDSGSPDSRPQRFPIDLHAKYRKAADSRPAAPARPQENRSRLTQGMQRILDQAQSGQQSRAAMDAGPADPHHIHVYAERHNCHITLTRPNRSPMLSLSAGNIGFKHAQRGSYDAAFQLASYSMSKMLEKGMVQEIKSLELVLRGFGAGREAFQKALLSNEGRILKGLIVRVTDATRLKFGGTRSKNVRRL